MSVWHSWFCLSKMSTTFVYFFAFHNNWYYVEIPYTAYLFHSVYKFRLKWFLQVWCFCFSLLFYITVTISRSKFTVKVETYMLELYNEKLIDLFAKPAGNEDVSVLVSVKSFRFTFFHPDFWCFLDVYSNFAFFSYLHIFILWGGKLMGYGDI